MFAEQIWILTRCYLIFLYNTTTTNIAAAAVQKLSVIIFFQKRHYCSGKQSKNICIWKMGDLSGLFMPIDMQKWGLQFV